MFYGDTMKGPWCRINGKHAYGEFGADLKEIVSSQGAVDATYIKTTGKSSLLLANSEFQTNTYTFTFYVVGSTEEQCDMNSSGLVAECQECVITTGDNEFEYAGVLLNYTVIKTGIEWYNEVTISLAAVKRLPIQHIVPSVQDVIIENKGSIESGLKITIRPQRTISEFTIADVKVYNISSGSEFVIDGINGDVLYNGENALLKTDLITFPKVKPGMNEITISSLDRVEVTLEYYPTMVV